MQILKIIILGFSEKTKSIMRKCLFDAGLIKRIGTLGLQFTTERKNKYCVIHFHVIF